MPNFETLIWAIGVATGAAQNVYVNGLMEKTLHVRIAWIDWLVVAAPFSIVMSVILYFLLIKMMRPETESTDQTDAIHQALAKLGPITPPERRLRGP